MDCDSERIWKIVESQRIGVPRKKHLPGSSLSLFDRLYDCYVDCLQTSNDKSADKRFRSAVNLLLRVERAHAKPSLIVSLYEDEKGYSLILCPSEGGETEEIFLPYEDNEIFSYLDNQEVPPVLMEILQQSQYCHLYNGSVVCELRDYRCHSVLDGYDKHLLLLRPTTETILATVNELAHESKCSHEEKLFLESRLLLATQPPICLDTSTDVLCVTNRLQYNRRKFHTNGIKRYLRKRCHASRALMELTADGEAPERLKLNDFVVGRNLGTQRRNFSNCWKKPKLSMPTPKESIDEIAMDVFKLAKPITQGPILTPPTLPPSVITQPTLPSSTLTQPAHPPPALVQPVLSQPTPTPPSPTPHIHTPVVRIPPQGPRSNFADDLLKRKQVTIQQQDHPRDVPQSPTPVPVTAPAEKPPPQQTFPPQQPATTLPQQTVVSISPAPHNQISTTAVPPPLQSVNLPRAILQNQQFLANQALRSLIVARQPTAMKNLGLRPITSTLPSLQGPRGMKNLSSTPPQLRAIAPKHRDVSAIVGSLATSRTGIKTDSTGVATVTVSAIPHTSATSAAFFVLPRQQGSPSLVSATAQTVPVPAVTIPTSSQVGGARAIVSTLTPPKLNPPPKLSSPSSQAVSSGMPKLHPLISELSKPPQLKMKPPPPVTVTPQPPPMVSKAMPSVVSTAAPSMPQLHRMPTALVPPGTKLSAPPLARVTKISSSPGGGVRQLAAIPSLKPNPNIPISSLRSTVVTTATITTALPPPPYLSHPPSTVSVVRTSPQQVQSAEAVRKFVEAQTRIPPSLSSLGTSGSPSKKSVAPSKHSQSRSSKLMTGTKVKGRKKKQ